MKAATRIRIRNTPARPAADDRQYDASGVAFDPKRHIAPDSLTKAGFFRLKPGQRRS